jgi:hypothetical protein
MNTEKHVYFEKRLLDPKHRFLCMKQGQFSVAYLYTSFIIYHMQDINVMKGTVILS